MVAASLLEDIVGIGSGEVETSTTSTREPGESRSSTSSSVFQTLLSKLIIQVSLLLSRQLRFN